MTPRQVRGLVAWELAPVAIAAVVAGSALGLALAFIVTGLLDLRPFVGGTDPVEPAVPVALVAAVSVGFALVVIAAGFIAIAAARRISPATTVKMGAE
jgi:putative ABC transport system permease protein